MEAERRRRGRGADFGSEDELKIVGYLEPIVSSVATAVEGRAESNCFDLASSASPICNSTSTRRGSPSSSAFHD